jgi:glycosyltransferase involved in cell wall biosynthesis
MNCPLVSIIIPTFNYGHLIEEALDSVCNQTYCNWECLIVDDGSTDDTRDIVNSFISHHPNHDLRYYYINNSGTSAAKNFGIDIAKGQYVQFLDADDLLLTEKLRIQAEVLSTSKAELVFSSSTFFLVSDEKKHIVNKYPKDFLATESLRGDQLVRKLITNNCMTISSPLASLDLIKRAGKFQGNLKHNEDWLLWFKVALLCPAFIFDNDSNSGTMIRIHSTSAMTNSNNMFMGEIVVRREIEKCLNDNRIPNASLFRKLNLDLLALHHIRSVNIREGVQHVLNSLLKNPIGSLSLFARATLKLCVRIAKNG